MPGSAAAPAARCRNCRRGSFIAPPTPFTSFDYLVGTGEQRGRHFNAECLGCLEIDRQLVLRRRLHREVGGLGTLQDAIDVAGRSPVVVDRAGAVRYQPAGFDEGAIEITAGSRCCAASWMIRWRCTAPTTLTTTISPSVGPRANAATSCSHSPPGRLIGVSSTPIGDANAWITAHCPIPTVPTAAPSCSLMTATRASC